MATTAGHDDAPVAAGAPHHIARPAQPSVPAPAGNMSEIRTEVRPASCAHPVLWPLCGSAEERQLADYRDEDEALAALRDELARPIREYRAGVPEAPTERGWRVLRAQLVAALAELPPPIDQLADVLDALRVDRPALVGRGRHIEVTVADAYGEAIPVTVDAGRDSLDAYVRWMRRAVERFGWRVVGVARLTAAEVEERKRGARATSLHLPDGAVVREVAS